MKLSEVRDIIRQVIAEAKEEKGGGLPKSGGKLVHLKKELDGLKKMKESLGSLQIAEGGETQPFVAEYAHMQKFVNELEKIKAAHAKLAEMLDNQISEVEGKVSSETNKIKELMGLIEKAPKEKKEKKANTSKHEKGETKAEEKEEHKKEEPKKKAKEIEESFASLEKKIEKTGKSKEAATKIAGAVANAKMHGAGKGPTAKQKARVAEELDTKKVYGGTGQNQGDTGSSLQFTVTEDTPEYFEIDFTLTPNSKYRQAGAGSRSPREKEYGYAKISKKDFNGQITVKGENFNIGKDFITNNL
jgi:septal ring factor EnvC (AmiA/AmiB activator)